MPEPSAAFATLPACYDLFTGGPQRLEREGPMLREVLDAAPVRQVIDAACGTGIHAVHLAENGADVLALDASEAMIAYAREARPHDRVDYRVADLRELPRGDRGAVFCLGNSLALLPDAAGLDAFFRSAGDALAPGGRLLTQTVNYSRPVHGEARHRIETAQRGAESVVAVKTLAPRGDVTLLTLAYYIEAHGHWRHCSETAVLRHWSPRDLEGAARAAGFGDVMLLGGFDGGPFDADASTDILLRATRA
jgi:SAM-dependent methyltransferase